MGIIAKFFYYGVTSDPVSDPGRLNDNKINTIRAIDMVSRVEKLPTEHDSFSQCSLLIP